MESNFEDTVNFLRRLIATPSFSGEEEAAADLWVNWLKQHNVEAQRIHNNVYALSPAYNPSKPVLLLNSHIDTVKPSASYTRNPFSPDIEAGKLYGLGSNDAGASGVALAETFFHFKDNNDLPFNLLLALTANEEKMGEHGMRAFLPFLKERGLYPHLAIVGEPTECKAAIAERGLVVCDAVVRGVAGHAARNEGVNAIYRAMEDIEILRHFKFPATSEILGPVKVSVTMIDAGTQHNVIPDLCHYVVDIRTTDAYSNEDTVELLQQAVKWSSLTPRSTRIRASALPLWNPLAQAAIETGLETFISSTTSDMALMHDIPSIKIGPGKSQRSHTADEFIELEEIHQGILTYNNYIATLAKI